MDIPAGWHELDFSGRFDHLDTHFTDHVGPLFVRGAEGARQLGFRVEPHMCNPAGICHGGMLMTVMDVGLAFGLHNAMGKHVLRHRSVSILIFSPRAIGRFFDM